MTMVIKGDLWSKESAKGFPVVVDCTSGHFLAEAPSELADGTFVGFCAGCGVRVTLRSVPGGSPVMRIRTLLGAATAMVEGIYGDDIRTAVSAMMSTVTFLKAELEKEQEALDRAAKTLDLARTLILRKRGELDGATN